MRCGWSLCRRLYGRGWSEVSASPKWRERATQPSLCARSSNCLMNFRAPLPTLLAHPPSASRRPRSSLRSSRKSPPGLPLLDLRQELDQRLLLAVAMTVAAAATAVMTVTRARAAATLRDCRRPNGLGLLALGYAHIFRD